MNGLVGFVVGGFKFAVGAVNGIGLMMETAVGQGAAQALVEEQEQERGLEAFVGETVGVARAIPFQQSVALELAEIVTQLV